MSWLLILRAEVFQIETVSCVQWVESTVRCILFYEKFRLNRPRVCIVFVRIVMKSLLCVLFLCLYLRVVTQFAEIMRFISLFSFYSLLFYLLLHYN